jgi:PHD/YefM family antitoxin component YafN of YafNO toxin-antitoxin module
MKTLELEKASKTLADYVVDLGSESLVITSTKKPVAILVSLEDMDRESLALSLSPEFGRIIRRARTEAKRGKVFSLKQVKEELLANTGARNRQMQPRVAAKRLHVPSARRKPKRSSRRG